jgi:hypothetical protein
MLSSLFAQEQQRQYQAEIVRSTAGNILNEKGFSAGTVQMKKGMIYDVTEQTLSDVILLDNGQRIRVPKSDVIVSERSSSSSDDQEGSGVLRIISAKYGRPGEFQYDVKQEIRKRISSGPIAQQIEILVSDKLLRARAASMTQSGVTDGFNIVMKKDSLCVLTIAYDFNDQRFTKEAIEGSTLKLP